MDPLTWIALALMVAGSAAQYKGNQKVKKESNKALAEERQRREKRQQANEATAMETEQLFKDQAAKEQAAAATREADTRTQIEAPTTDAAGATTMLDPLSPPSMTNIADVTDQINRANDYLSTRAKLRAQLGGYNDVMQQTGAAAMRNAQDITNRNKDIQAWQQYVLPARLAYAGQSGQQWSTAGDVMKLAAMIMAPYALGTGGSAGAAGQAAGGAASGAIGGGAGAGAGAAIGGALGSAAPAAATVGTSGASMLGPIAAGGMSYTDPSAFLWYGTGYNPWTMQPTRTSAPARY